MLLAFLIPLLLGVVTKIIFSKKKKKILKKSTNSIFNNGIITLTIGSILKGILDIYGTTNKLLIIYLILGVLLIIIAIFSYFFSNKKLS